MGFRWSGVQIPPARPNRTPNPTNNLEIHAADGDRLKSVIESSSASSRVATTGEFLSTSPESDAATDDPATISLEVSDERLHRTARARGRTRRTDADHREVGTGRVVSRARAADLGPSDPLPANGGRRRDLRSQAASDKTQSAAPDRVRPKRKKWRQLGRGLLYDQATRTAKLSVYVKGRKGRKRL